jgi:phage terminase small subunit
MQSTQLLVMSPVQKIPIQNPYLPIVNRQMLLMLRAASELGFTPCSRARIDAASPPTSANGAWDDVEETG